MIEDAPRITRTLDHLHRNTDNVRHKQRAIVERIACNMRIYHAQQASVPLDTSLNVPVARSTLRFAVLVGRPARDEDTILFADRTYLAAYLAARRDLCVHVRVRSAGADGGDDCGKVTSRELLLWHRPLYDVCRCDRPTHGPLLRALRGKAGRIRTSRRLAQKDNDAAAEGGLADMVVGLSYGRL